MGNDPEVDAVVSASTGPCGKDETKLGDGSEGGDAVVWFTALWFDGRMLSDGELGTGGGGIC